MIHPVLPSLLCQKFYHQTSDPLIMHNIISCITATQLCEQLVNHRPRNMLINQTATKLRNAMIIICNHGNTQIITVYPAGYVMLVAILWLLKYQWQLQQLVEIESSAFEVILSMPIKSLHNGRPHPEAIDVFICCMSHDNQLTNSIEEQQKGNKLFMRSSCFNIANSVTHSLFNSRFI